MNTSPATPPAITATVTPMMAQSCQPIQWTHLNARLYHADLSLVTSIAPYEPTLLLRYVSSQDYRTLERRRPVSAEVAAPVSGQNAPAHGTAG